VVSSNSAAEGGSTRTRHYAPGKLTGAGYSNAHYYTIPARIAVTCWFANPHHAGRVISAFNSIENQIADATHFTIPNGILYFHFFVARASSPAKPLPGSHPEGI
jgi:hypothetical protein